MLPASLSFEEAEKFVDEEYPEAVALDNIGPTGTEGRVARGVVNEECSSRCGVWGVLTVGKSIELDLDANVLFFGLGEWAKGWYNRLSIMAMSKKIGGAD